MVREGCTQTEAALACGVSQGRLSEYLRGLWPAGNGPSLRRFEAECREIVRRAYRGLSRDARIRARFPCRVVFLDDLHVPFTDSSVVEEVVRREAGADYLVTFEVATFDAFSRFDQTYLDEPAAEQTLAARLLTELAGHFGEVVCGTSNHMDRPEKGIVRNLRPEQQEYVLANLRDVYAAIREAGIRHVASPFIQIGDAIFAHFDRTLGTPGATPQELLKRVRSHHDVYGLSADPAACFTGHTHRVAQVPMEGGKGYLYEVGCGTYLPPYVLRSTRGGKIRNYRMACGYGVAVFDSRGRIDLTESRAVHLGWARLPDAAGR